MIKAGHWGIGLILSGWALIGPSSASGQMAPPPPPSANNAPNAAMMMNPYLNPYMNPLLNPGAPQQKMGTGNALLYMYSAQAARGGIGSGRLSNPGPSASQVNKKKARVPNSASVPGGSASRYFNAGAGNGRGGTGQYYSRYGGHFQNNGN